MATAAIQEMTDEQFEREAFDVIKREFGLGGLARFIRLHRSGTGDYTAERQSQLSPTLAEIIRDLERLKGTQSD